MSFKLNTNRLCTYVYTCSPSRRTEYENKYLLKLLKNGEIFANLPARLQLELTQHVELDQKQSGQLCEFSSMIFDYLSCHYFPNNSKVISHSHTDSYILIPMLKISTYFIKYLCYTSVFEIGDEPLNIYILVSGRVRLREGYAVTEAETVCVIVHQK